MVAAPISGDQAPLIEADDAIAVNLLRAAVVYGANASGKTNVLRAFSAMRTAVLDSHDTWGVKGAIPISPFALDPTAPTEPTRFEIEVLLKGIRYRYGFEYDADCIRSEWLYVYPKGYPQRWFTRSEDNEFAFNRSLTGAHKIKSLTRRASLFLSAAIPNNFTVLEPLYDWFKAMKFQWPQHRAFNLFFALNQCKDVDYSRKMAKLLRAADLGITGITSVDRDITKEYYEMVKDLLPDAPSEPETEQLAPSAAFEHVGPNNFTATLSIEDESDGTRTLLALLRPMIVKLANGGILFIDELESSLHPELARQIVQVFNTPSTNPRNAQLVFTTHDTTLLDGDLLRRDQIWFTEKGKTGVTKLYPLSDYLPRQNENLQRGYLQGRFGATPFIDLLSIFHEIENDYGKKTV